MIGLFSCLEIPLGILIGLFSGSAFIHVVKDSSNQILRPPQWMWDSPNWGYMLSDDEEGFCPTKGIWHWDNPSVSRGVRALGTAICSAFFPEKTDEESIAEIERAGTLLAEHCISFVWKHEPLTIDSNDIIDALIRYDVGVLEKLISP